MYTDDQLRKVIRFSKSAPIEPEEAARSFEERSGILLPKCLKRIHMLGGGSSLSFSLPGGTAVSCDLHALAVNPFEYYGSDMIAAHKALLSQLDKCRNAFRRVFPFGQDGSGGQFCLDYRTQNEPLISLYNWDYDLIARSFDELIERALVLNQNVEGSHLKAISNEEQQEFLSLLPEDW